MRTIPTALQTHLDTGATTVCWCWRVERTDAVVMGFTNHDKDLSFDGVTYEADAGQTGSELESSVGLSVDNMEVEGAISSDQITVADIESGVYDGATVTIYLVNWADVSQRVILAHGTMGEVVYGSFSYRAEFRGLSAIMDQQRGRTYQYTCDAELGDTRCAVNLASAAYRGSGVVTASGGRGSMTASGLGAFTGGWFENGVLTFTSGANDGRSFEVRSFGAGSSASISLWAPTSENIQIGDGFDIVAGCDKFFRTCKAKFSNSANFRGFPHIPPDEEIISYPNSGDKGLDGGGNYVGAD